MSMIQGSRLPPEPIKLLIDERMKIKSSWGSRSVTIQTANNGPHTIKLKELVKLLGQKVETAKSPGDIKRTREMLRTIKELEGKNRNPITKFLDYVGVTNDYDTKFAVLGKKIEAPLLREEHQKELADLKLSLESKENELPEAELKEGKESSSNAINGTNETSANVALIKLNKDIKEIKDKIEIAQEVIDLSFPETKEIEPETKEKIEKMVEGYMGTPEQEDSAKTAAFSAYDKLKNVGNDLRLFGAEMAAKVKLGHATTEAQKSKLKFIQSLNNIPKDIPLKKINDESLAEKKDYLLKI